ncbi:MAG: hypothetical protein O2884_09300 [Chloroflexi bacterium]|nr:hypothetical protein [Chloroflexota bacterium]
MRYVHCLPTFARVGSHTASISTALRRRTGSVIGLSLLAIPLLATIACEQVIEDWKVRNDTAELLIVFGMPGAYDVIEPGGEGYLAGEACPCPVDLAPHANTQYLIRAYEFVVGDGEYARRVPSESELLRGSTGELLFCAEIPRAQLVADRFNIKVFINQSPPYATDTSLKTCL